MRQQVGPEVLFGVRKGLCPCPRDFGIIQIFFRGGASQSRLIRQNAAKQSSLGMSEVSSATILMQRQAHTLARLSPYFAKGFSDSLKRDRREAVSSFGCRVAKEGGLIR